MAIRPTVPEWPASLMKGRPFVPEWPASLMKGRSFVPEWARFADEGTIICARMADPGSGSWSGVGADRAERADRARTLRVLWPEAELARRDARRGHFDSCFDAGVVGGHLDDLPAAQVEQEQARAPAPGHEPPPSPHPVAPPLHPVP